MFKSAELPWLITFFQMFYNDKPVDWLLEHLIYTKVCNWEKDVVSNWNVMLQRMQSVQFSAWLVDKWNLFKCDLTSINQFFLWCLTFSFLFFFLVVPNHRNTVNRKKQNYGYITSHHYFNTSAPHHHWKEKCRN